MGARRGSGCLAGALLLLGGGGGVVCEYEEIAGGAAEIVTKRGDRTLRLLVQRVFRKPAHRVLG